MSDRVREAFDGIFFINVDDYRTSNLDSLEIGDNAATDFLTRN